MTILPLILRWHRRIGLLVALPVLLWTLSGVLHPIMSRLNPQPVNFMSPRALAANAHWLAPGMALQQAGITQAQALRLVTVGGKPYYQVIQASTAHKTYIDAHDGSILTQGEQQQALELALHYTGRSADSVRAVQYLDQFDEDYLWINRLLPVWRIDFYGEDHLSVYVETAPARLAAMVDDTKRITSSLFRLLHTWDGLPEHPLVNALMILLLLLAAAMGIGGAVLYGILWQKQVLARRRGSGQRWHRSLGLGISLFATLFAASGAWHRLHMPSPPATAEIPPPTWNTDRLDTIAAADLWGQQPDSVIVGCGDSLCRLIAPRAGPHTEHHHHGGAPPAATFALQPLSASGAPTTLDTWAIQAARQALSLSDTAPLDHIETLTEFSDEYGFLNKRLPVLKIAFTTEDHAAAYWEPSTGAIASVVRDTDRYEGYSFAFLHKHHWLDFAGKDVRDAMMALAALLIAVVTCLGVSLGWRRGWR